MKRARYSEMKMKPRELDEIERKIRALDPLDFEEMCADLITELGFVNVRRQGGGTQFGHDIAAELIAERVESWHFECKRYARTVPLKEISNKLLWADTVESLDYFVVMSNAQISNDFRQLISMPSPRPYRILAWTGPVFRRLLTACSSSKQVPAGEATPAAFLAEQRGYSLGNTNFLAHTDEGSMTITVRRARNTPGDDPCYAVIKDYAGNVIMRIKLKRGRKIHLQLPKEALGKPVRVWYDFHPYAMLARHYPDRENIVLAPDLLLPSENLKRRIEAIVSIPQSGG